MQLNDIRLYENHRIQVFTSSLSVVGTLRNITASENIRLSEALVRSLSQTLVLISKDQEDEPLVFMEFIIPLDKIEGFGRVVSGKEKSHL